MPTFKLLKGGREVDQVCALDELMCTEPAHKFEVRSCEAPPLLSSANWSLGTRGLRPRPQRPLAPAPNRK